MIDITSDLKELNISYDKINVLRQGENSDTFLITTSKKKLIAKKFKNLNFQIITNTYLNKKILNQLVDKKLFPKVVYQSEEKDFLIYEYVESIKSNKDKLFYKNLGMKIREIHEIKPCKNNLTFEEQLNFLLTEINKEQLAREADGTVVVVDGYNRTNVKEWAMANMPQWAQKNPRPQGGGATTTKVQTEFVSSDKNPFAPDSFNLTEQARLYRTDINKYNMLKNAVTG